MIFTRLYGSQVCTRMHDVVGAGASFRCPDLIALQSGLPFTVLAVLIVREYLPDSNLPASSRFSLALRVSSQQFKNSTFLTGLH